MEKIARNELPDLINRVLAALPQKSDRASVIALQGDLGAGKTTFVQHLAKALGVAHSVQSPTYVLMRSYPIPQGDTLTPGLSKVSPFKKLIHIDAYRLTRPEEFAALRPEEFLHDATNLVCIEWPERVEGVLPKPDIIIKFSSEAATEGERYIQVV